MMENKSESDYPTDEFGRPNGRDYHYRIPLNNDAAARLASLALNGMFPYKDRFVVEWKGFSGDSISYMGIRTNDSKGHLDGLAQYAHSPKWESVGPMSDIDEYRSGRSGGTKVRGSFRVDPQSFNGIQRLSFDTVIDVTPSELETALQDRGDIWDRIQETIHWAKQDSMDNAREQIANEQRNCEHEHAVFPDRYISEHGGSGYCEDCGAELTENNELAY